MKRDENRMSRQWNISGRRGDTLAEDVLIFLGDLCKGHGFCSVFPSDVLAASEPLTAEVFATAILHAEGWPDTEQDYEWHPQFVKLFTERYGPVISAAEYKRPT